MKLNLLAFAIPFFLLFMVLEYAVARRRNKKVFNLHNSIANVSIGIAERLLDVLVTGAFYFVYRYIQEHFGFFSIRGGVVMWVILFICTDFIWYWYHRLAHEVSLFWAAHVVHHQSEDFNYTVSARITVFQAFIRTGFWAVLPLMGFPAEMITSILLMHGLYPFFIHTQLIGKLGVLEYIFVTPSHHRVHHASNEEYLDKNYGDVLIIWDKLFGTFQEEKDVEIRYGLTRPLNSYSFLWQHFHFWAEIVVAMRTVKGWKKKMALLLGKPDLIPDYARTRSENFFRISKHDSPDIKGKLNQYVVWQMVLMFPLSFLTILYEHQLSGMLQFMFVLLILVTLINCGAIMEQRIWVFHLEFARWLLCVIVVLYTFPNMWLGGILMAIALVLCCFYETSWKYYLRLLYNHRVT
ncbi:sterol desaturase family protein [Parasegetibacter sp. NRK P23]|uniref:sterol desaturase family protein n=1 Tax=Parasegetibacter sp. NRK P23 TaxID=2942999 RepID=UPI0020442FA8|nr:sterol desaturase family protein [Parasegetibacter sp. NRK P23]MCM5530055.1 sterol desaturase family protein [Parasegetibacter sp. NRK P23]